LYILNEIKQGQKKYIIEEQSVSELIQKLSDESLNVVFIENNNEQFINELYQKAKERGILRNIVPKIDYVKNMIRSNQETIEKCKDRMQFVEPLEKQKLSLDIDILEKDNEDLTKQLEKLHA